MSLEFINEPTTIQIDIYKIMKTKLEFKVPTFAYKTKKVSDTYTPILNALHPIGSNGLQCL